MDVKTEEKDLLGLCRDLQKICGSVSEMTDGADIPLSCRDEIILAVGKTAELCRKIMGRMFASAEDTDASSIEEPENLLEDDK